jgi:hypothetical protein
MNHNLKTQYQQKLNRKRAIEIIQIIAVTLPAELN